MTRAIEDQMIQNSHSEVHDVWTHNSSESAETDTELANDNASGIAASGCVSGSQADGLLLLPAMHSEAASIQRNESPPMKLNYVNMSILYYSVYRLRRFTSIKYVSASVVTYVLSSTCVPKFSWFLPGRST